MVQIQVDGKILRVNPDQTVLEACLENGVYIPNLCFMKSREHPHASCRLCFVEVEDRPKPVTACTLKVQEGLTIRTDTPRVRRLQRSAFKLLMSTHICTPKECPTHWKCSLIRMAKFLKTSLKPAPLERLERDVDQEVDLGFFLYYPYRCVLCGKCIHHCRDKNGRNILTFAKRGFDTVVVHFPALGPEDVPCENCGTCVHVCPTGALVPKKDPGAATAASA